MNLLRTAPTEVQSAGLEKLRNSAFRHGQSAVSNKKALSLYATLLDRDEKSTRVVAELYNPERFKGEAKRQGLIPGQAFDLDLGHDLLDPHMRNEVRSYVRTVKPGLVLISPPCKWHSILQNLRPFADRSPEKQQEYLRNLIQAKVLLRFGVEIAKEVASYGGYFVFEHPVTSKAWSDRVLQQLMMREDVVLAKGDQCMFGLQSKTGVPRRKSTGWCTNSSEIAEMLTVKCDGTHEHDMIIGKDGSENKSTQAQRYPAGLVQAIIKGYKKQIREELLRVEFCRIDHLLQDCLHLQRIQNELVPTEHLISDFDIMTAEHETDEEHEDSKNDEMPDDEEISEEPETVEEPGGETEGAENPKYTYLPRERPFSLPQLVKRAHDGLGHPANDRLVRILRHAGASQEAIRLAREHKCAVCARHEKVKPPRPAAPP